MRTIREKLANRSQGGFSTIDMAMATAATAGMLAVAATAAGASEGDADLAACQYEKRLVMNSVELAHASASEYPEAEGEDGFGAVRDAGWLASESEYWIYLGPDEDGRPAYAVSRPVDGCE